MNAIPHINLTLQSCETGCCIIFSAASNVKHQPICWDFPYVYFPIAATTLQPIYGVLVA